MIVFVLLGALAMATMVNAPAIFLGYGLAYLVTLLAAWMFKPKKAFIAVLIATLLATPIMTISKAVFLEVALLNAIVRPPVAYVASVVRWRKGLLESTFTLTALETLVALMIALLYYGDDGIHTSLTIFGIFLAPFAYTIYRSIEREDKPGIVAGSLASLVFFFSIFIFPAVIPLIVAVVFVSILLLSPRFSRIVAVMLAAALILSAMGSTAFRENIEVSMYPFIPQNWGKDRWIQDNSSCGITSNVFANTHTPERLRIVERCVVVTGRVERPPFIAGDGDYCFDLIPESDRYLGVGNYILRKGALHVEIVPSDQSVVLGQIEGVCPGDRLKVVGVWVVDTDHGMWTEIHPAVKVEILSTKSEKRWPDCVLGRQFED